MFRTPLLISMGIILVLILGSSPVLAQKTLSGNIATDTVLDTVGGAVYEVLSNVSVADGVLLTIDPGVTLKFNPSTQLIVHGTLHAEGGSTPSSTIVFTSIKDDTAPVGAGEDTNGDGGASSPAKGDWYYISFTATSSSASSMRWCEVRYTGLGNVPAIQLADNSAPTIQDCILNNGYTGIKIFNESSPIIRNTAISNMTMVPIDYSIDSNPVFDNIILNTPTGNGTDAIRIFDAHVDGAANIPRPSATIGGVSNLSLAYWVSSTIQIAVDDSLNIEPGVVLKFASGAYVNNTGLLTALGGATADSLIYFTSFDDDNSPEPNGQDTNINGNNTYPDWQDWRGIRFTDQSDDNSVLRHCKVLFAGGGSSSYGAIDCSNASPTLRNCDITAAYYGVKGTGVSKPVLINTSINAMQDVPVAIQISSDPVFDGVTFASSSDNGFDAIGILGGTLYGSNTLRIRGANLGENQIDNLTYILLSDITVDATGDLTIDPGVVVKPKSSVDIFVNGSLHMDGTAVQDSLIVFTSYKDDNIGNPADTNNDGSNTSPATGNWGGIHFNPGSTGSVSHSQLRFGGSSQSALITAKSASPTLHNLLLQNTYYGIKQEGTAASVITDVEIANTTFTPVLMSISADPVFSNLSFTNVGLSAIGLIPETVGVDAVLRVRSLGGYDNISYYLNGSITVATGAHFRFEPGVVIKISSVYYGYDLIIDGSLQAVSTPDSTIAFTSIYDDSRGNPFDTAGDGSATTPAASNWGHIKFTPVSLDEVSILQGCDLAYGGKVYNSQEAPAAVWCQSSSPTIRDNNFNTNNIGVWTDGNSAPLIQDNTFFNQTSTPFATSVVSNPNYQGNIFNQNGIHAVGLIAETIAADATIEKLTNMGMPSYPYYNFGIITVGSGTTLTIEPGVIIKAYSTVFNVHGALQAVGSVEDRIIITSLKDDSYGGDSNVDGAQTSPVAANWTGLRFSESADDANCLIENCLFRFGGAGHIIDIYSASPTIRNNEIELCKYGIGMWNDSEPVIQDNLFRVLTWLPITKSVLSQPVFGGNIMDNVPYQCIGIRGEHIGQDMTLRKWDFGGYTNITQVLIGADLTIDLGATLTVDPGIVFKMKRYNYPAPFAQSVFVDGSLVADGTQEEPIIFTSLLDDSVGNPSDTNGDGASSTPSTADWGGFGFEEVSDDATAIMDFCEIRYGSSSGVVICDSASPVISNCKFSDAGYALVSKGNSNPYFINNVVNNMSFAPVQMSLTSEPHFSGNQFLSGNRYNALAIRGETLAQDATIKAQNVGQIARIPYLLSGPLTAGFSSILHIEPGVVIKGYHNITIQRGLIAEGGSSPDSLIVFTSLADDFYGGDTNNDGDATDPDDYHWGRIIIQNEAIDDSTSFKNVVFRYGYNSTNYGVLDINSANPKIDNCTFAYNGTGVYYKGISGDPTEGWIHNSDFISNTYYGVRNEGTAFTVDATGNWWGHASGPMDSNDDTGSGGYYNPTGLGDPVSDGIDYGTWETDGIQNLLLGDVSRNGDVRAYDASLILQELVTPGQLGPLQEVLGDVDCTGSLMALDASMILRFVAGMDTYFPCALDSVPTKKLDELPAYITSAPVSFVAELPEAMVDADQTTWVPVQLSGSGDVFGQEYHIQFDPTQVSVTNVRLLPEAQGSALAWAVEGGNQLRIAIASLDPLAVVDAVEFELLGASSLPNSENADLMLAFARLNEEEMAGTSGLDDIPAPGTTRLFQNNPNPFNPMTTIKFAVGDDQGAQPVKLTIFDARGHLVKVLVNESRSPGVHEVLWDSRDTTGRRVGSGLYLYKLDVAGKVMINKMLLLK